MLLLLSSSSLGHGRQKLDWDESEVTSIQHMRNQKRKERPNFEPSQQSLEPQFSWSLGQGARLLFMARLAGGPMLPVVLAFQFFFTFYKINSLDKLERNYFVMNNQSCWPVAPLASWHWLAFHDIGTTPSALAVLACAKSSWPLRSDPTWTLSAVIIRQTHHACLSRQGTWTSKIW